MNLAELREYCTQKPGVVEDFPFDFETLAFKVAGKMFAITNIKWETLKVNLKCDPIRAIALREQYEEVQPGYHMNKKHWNTVTLQGRLPAKLTKELIDHSYELVVGKLPKAKREALSKQPGQQQ